MKQFLTAAFSLSLVALIAPGPIAATPVNPVGAAYAWGAWQKIVTRESNVPTAIYRGAKRHHRTIRTKHGMFQVSFPTQIEHVVVIVMENRTVDNLFDGFYNTAYPTGGTFGDASHLNLCNPNSPTQCAGHGPLTQYNLLCAPNCAFHDTSKIDPIHSHANSFWFEAQNWSLGDNVFRAGNGYETFGCPWAPCKGATALSYVNPGQSWPYASLFAGPYNASTQSFAGNSVGEFASNVLQSNEGPSWVAHQYLISGQSGGFDLTGPTPGIAPDAMVENPGFNGINQWKATGNDVFTPGTVPDEEDNTARYVGCGSKRTEATANMGLDYKTARADELNGQTPPLPQACSEYPTILDEAAEAGFSWEYISHNNTSIWAAPLGVRHLYANVIHGQQSSIGFQTDPNARRFVNGLYMKQKDGTYPAIPNLTYITPCLETSDHPNDDGGDGGPGWLPWVINEIAQSPNPTNWQNTVFLVTWDDWGGWFDSYQPTEPGPNDPFPFHPYPNPYNQVLDANEWGFRVPLVVISPYITQPGYVSSAPSSVGLARSQGGILSLIEDMFNLPRLSTDDTENVNAQNASDLSDMINLQGQPLPYQPLNTQGYTPGCNS
jgi:hypothetical protein